MKQMIDDSCRTFVQELASSAPVPGGGGASAFCGALGVALGNMVGSLTTGKKKYADVQEDIARLQKAADQLQAELLELVGQDAEVFAPLAAAYSLPKETQEQRAHKEAVLQKALLAASEVPLQIMRCCCEGLDLLEEFAEKGSAIAISDAGVGTAFCRAALLGASMNVFINTKLMSDRPLADRINGEADNMLAEYPQKADRIFSQVQARLR